MNVEAPRIPRTRPVRLPRLNRNRAELPTNCLLVGEGQSARIHYATDEQFFALCRRMLNGNDPCDFVVGYRDAEGKPQYQRAHKANAYDHAQWVADAFRGRASRPATMALYARNASGESCWGGLDFDNHDSDRERPRAFALAAFNLLLQLRELRLILCTSGESGGWHLFIFSDHFHPVADWERLLRQIAVFIGAPIQPGVCEVMPRQTRGRFGPALRPPGSWNPRDDSFGEIYFDNVRPTLPAVDLKRITSFNLGKEAACCEGSETLARELGQDRPFGELGKEQALFRGRNDRWRTEFAIAAPKTRHDRLLALVGKGYLQASRDVLRRNAAAQHHEAKIAPATSFEDHLTDFEEMWRGQDEGWLGALLPAERAKVGALRTETQRAAFRIVRGWSLADPSAADFRIHAKSLAHRLGITLAGACEIRNRFCSLGILRKTQDYKPRALAARYVWLLTTAPSAPSGAPY